MKDKIKEFLKYFNKEFREIKAEESRLFKIDSKLSHLKKMYELRLKIEETNKEADRIINIINPKENFITKEIKEKIVESIDVSLIEPSTKDLRHLAVLKMELAETLLKAKKIREEISLYD